jgi:signal transduction histidine kinase
MISLELVSIFELLQAADTRRAGAAALAAWCGVARVLVFGKDPEIGLFLPAPGLPQTLRAGARWQQLLCACADHGSAHGPVPDPDAEGERQAWAQRDEAGSSVLVFLDRQPAEPQRSQVAALQPLLGATLAAERTALAADGHALAARAATRHASALNTALDASRRELQTACERAERELDSRREAERRLRDTDRRKDEFLAMLAHELRNPLAPISMAAHLLKLGGTSEAQLAQTGAVIDRQVRHMASLLDDLLDVSRVTTGAVPLAQELLDLRAIVHDAIEQTEPLIAARGHHLALELTGEPAPVCADRTRLVQVVANLLNNATKYTPEGGALVLGVALLPGQVELTVRDNGIGIGPELLPHVFDLFIQGERSPDRAQGGLGLGLALVKRLVERHGGTVEAHSAGRGVGSRFVVRLPLAAAHGAPAVQAAASRVS